MKIILTEEKTEVLSQIYTNDKRSPWEANPGSLTSEWSLLRGLHEGLRYPVPSLRALQERKVTVCWL